MKHQISERLRCCADLIDPGARVADIGTDHGYLPIWLVTQGIASAVYAADLREKPLQRARENARANGVEAKISFRRSDGLCCFNGTEMDTIVCAGMGADLIISILERTPWLRSSRYTLILQPQSSGQDLRRYLAEHGFSIEREVLVREKGFLYAVIRARFSGEITALSPGRQFVSPQLLADGSVYLPMQMDRLISSLQKTVEGISCGHTEADAEKLHYYQAALDELKTMRKDYDNGK